MKKQSYVLLGDVVKSRSIKKRTVFENRLKDALETVQKKYASEFSAQVKNWKGIDEIAGVMITPIRIYEIVNIINNKIAPQKMRFVLVKGAIDIGSGETDVTRKDGEAFHKAAAMMIELKKNRWLFMADTGSALADKALQTQVNLMFFIQEPWTATQRLIYREYQELEQQAAVARKMKISQQSVSKTLQSINGAEISSLEKQLITWIHATY